MFPGCLQDFARLFSGCSHGSYGPGGIISNESMDFNDPKESDDPQLFDDPRYSMIPSYSMINWKCNWNWDSLRDSLGYFER